MTCPSAAPTVGVRHVEKRPLHYVLKIGDRTESMHFFRHVLGMTVLRHEEFLEGCNAKCNGPYDGQWSKTMIGYGSEDNHFVMELVYNYNIGSYKVGNDLIGITIVSDKVMTNVQRNDYPCEHKETYKELVSPDGYRFFIVPETPDTDDPVSRVSLHVSDLDTSIDYWSRLLGMKVQCKTEKKAKLKFLNSDWKLELIKTEKEIARGTAYGRIAFAVPTSQLSEIENMLKKEKQTILTSLLALKTPGKATVEVVIAADPDQLEICFVGDEAFRQLSQVDPMAPTLLEEAMYRDKSKEWFSKKKKEKMEG
ncbi:glyoxalase domain-containing protein 4-like [Argonauta hians]